MSKATHRAKVLAYCKEHGSITVRDACVKLGINSPTKVISTMRLSGCFDVESVDESRSDDSGNTVYYKRYFIKERSEVCGHC